LKLVKWLSWYSICSRPDRLTPFPVSFDPLTCAAVAF
jgi:hypothetical protein